MTESSGRSDWSLLTLPGTPLESAETRAFLTTLAPPQLAESKGWKWPPQPFYTTNHDLLATWRATVVIYRAPHSGGGYDAYVAVNLFVTGKWRTFTSSKNPPGGFYSNTYFLDAPQGSALFQVVNPGFDVRCGDNDPNHFSQHAIDPDLFDLTKGMAIQIVGGYTWNGCPSLAALTDSRSSPENR